MIQKWKEVSYVQAFSYLCSKPSLCSSCSPAQLLLAVKYQPDETSTILHPAMESPPYHPPTPAHPLQPALLPPPQLPLLAPVLQTPTLPFSRLLPFSRQLLLFLANFRNTHTNTNSQPSNYSLLLPLPSLTQLRFFLCGKLLG